MIYKSRDGIVLTQICDEYLLVAAKSLGPTVPYLLQINETTAFCWELLEKGITFENLVQEIYQSFDIVDAALVRHDIKQLLTDLLKNGYLIQES